jgi:sugar lactone lactonase YvrE
MKKWVLLALLLAGTPLSSLLAQTPVDKSIVKVDPSLDGIISPHAKLELVKGDFGFTEGIVWVDQGNSDYLLLSDMYANVIYKLTPDGKVSLHLDHSGYTGYDIWRVGMPQPDPNRKDVFFMIGSNDLALDRQGRLLIATWSGPEFVANVCFGDRDNKTLYVAARAGVYKIRVNIPGLR